MSQVIEIQRHYFLPMRELVLEQGRQQTVHKIQGPLLPSQSLETI
jgi:hypothetical protein